MIAPMTLRDYVKRNQAKLISSEAQGKAVDWGWAKGTWVDTPLFYAATLGHLDTAQALMECGADVNERGENGATALDGARLFGHFDMVRLLESHGGVGSATLRMEDYAEVDAVDPRASAFLRACAAGDDEAVRRMLREQPEVIWSTSARRGETGMHLAAQFGHEAVVDLLLAAGLSGYDENNLDEEAVSVAWHHGRTELALKLERLAQSDG